MTAKPMTQAPSPLAQAASIRFSASQPAIRNGNAVGFCYRGRSVCRRCKKRGSPVCSPFKRMLCVVGIGTLRLALRTLSLALSDRRFSSFLSWMTANDHGSSCMAVGRGRAASSSAAGNVPADLSGAYSRARIGDDRWHPSRSWQLRAWRLSDVSSWFSQFVSQLTGFFRVLTEFDFSSIPFSTPKLDNPRPRQLKCFPVARLQTAGFLLMRSR